MELKSLLSEKVSDAVRTVFEKDCHIELTIPEPEFGDFSTNIALQLASQLSKGPRDIATELCFELKKSGLVTDVAGPGFINISVTDEDLFVAATKRNISVFEGETYVVEYSCPNYFKELHAGHLYQTIYGDALARMIERAGAKVYRTNFGADVGLSAARAMWGMIKRLGGELPERLRDIAPNERSAFIAQSYVAGAQADTGDNQDEKVEISQINKRIYTMHAEQDTSSDFARVYFTTREWCREYFIQLYEELEVDPFDKFYPESTTEARGIAEVMSRVGSVFAQSQGAIVYEGEKDGLHTRVFITKENLPTYETKDLGLVLIELDEFRFDKRILITGSEQSEYMKVVWRAVDHVVPGLESRMKHLTNGLIRFGDGKKMSSRLGNVTTAMDVIHEVRKAVGSSGDADRDTRIYLGALKYELLKYRLGGDIAFDPKSSVSLQGNSGPYLQYSAVRAASILSKLGQGADTVSSLDSHERALVRVLSHYQLVLEEATRNYETHTLANYLYELASAFNVFYENCRVSGDEREAIRTRIVAEYSDTLGHGLELLGIAVPDKM